MTRNEASQKWCPMARAPVSYTTSEYVGGQQSNILMNKQHFVSGNRNGNYPDPACMCIADKCMLWRSPLGDPEHGHCGMGM